MVVAAVAYSRSSFCQNRRKDALQNQCRLNFATAYTSRVCEWIYKRLLMYELHVCVSVCAIEGVISLRTSSLTRSWLLRKRAVYCAPGIANVCAKAGRGLCLPLLFPMAATNRAPSWDRHLADLLWKSWWELFNFLPRAKPSKPPRVTPNPPSL